MNSKKYQFKLDKPSSYTLALEENTILREYLQEELKLSQADIKAILEKSREILLPLSIFRNDLSTLEVIVKYLHEEKKLAFVDIAHLLQRDERTIWHAHHRAVQKNIHLIIQKPEMSIPLSIFSHRQYAPLEALVSHLKDHFRFSLTEIARHLNLSPKTIWTVYHRSQKKHHGQ